MRHEPKERPESKHPIRQLTREIFVVKGYDRMIPSASIFNLAIKDRVHAVVDTGAIANFEEVFPRESVSIIVNSHFHMDHTRHNETFPNARVWLHEMDAPFLTDRVKMRYCLGVDRYGIPEAERILEDGGIVLRRVDQRFSDGHVFEFGATRMIAIHAPGHTPGHCMFHFPQEDILYSADIDFSKWGPGYRSPLSSIEDTLKSIERVKEIHPRLVVSGHTGVIEVDIRKKADRYAGTVLRREEVLFECLKEPMDTEAILDLRNIASEYPHPYYRIFIMGMIELHLERLMKQGRIVQLEDGRYRQEG